MSIAETNRRFLWIDTGVHSASPIVPLAIDEALANGMSQPDAQPTIHFWICEHSLFLGRRDARLPHLEAALKAFGQDRYSAVLRSSGGACVPLDRGVINMAILLPDTNISIDAFFQLAADMLEIGLKPFGHIKIGEVTGSYCVGDYDFALAGKKIGGMAQRRTRHGSILQLCINVEPGERGSLMERFYHIAGLQEMTANRPIPSIDGTTVTSLSECANRFVSTTEVKQHLFQGLCQHWQIEFAPLTVTAEQIESARQHLQDRLGLFACTHQQLADPAWRLPVEK